MFCTVSEGPCRRGIRPAFTASNSHRRASRNPPFPSGRHIAEAALRPEGFIPDTPARKLRRRNVRRAWIAAGVVATGAAAGYAAYRLYKAQGGGGGAGGGSGSGSGGSGGSGARR